MLLRGSLLSAVILGALVSGTAQEAQKTRPSQPEETSVSDTLRQLQQQVNELRSAVTEMRTEAERYRLETVALRRELRTVLAPQAAPTDKPSVESYGAPAPVGQETADSGDDPTPQATNDRLTKLEEQFQLLSGQTGDQYQTKVESASRYRVRFNGIALFNLATTRGTVDDIDLPLLTEGITAGRGGGSFAATLRQSQIGMEVVGPEIAGAKTRGNIQFDFAGGFPQTAQGVTFGLVRLRTATVRLDWAHTSIVAGQDAPFFSALSPTSVATLATPALAYAGNLWTWVPQLRVEHRHMLTEKSSLLLQAGIFDSLTGESPSYFYRRPQAGEASRQPGYGTRVAWTQEVLGHPVTLGAGGYYARQDWGFGRHVDGWAGTVDWSIPLGHGFSVTGEFFRGRAIGGLGGALDHSVVLSGPAYDSLSQVHGLNALGGWSQLKFKPAAKLEFNAAVGQDNSLAGEVRRFPFSPDYVYGDLVRNRSALLNVIYRPRSNLLFSTEYRHIQSFELDTTNHTADHVNVVMGILF